MSFANDGIEKGRTMRFFVGRLVSAGMVIIASAGAASAQTQGPGRALVASNVVTLSADTTRSGVAVSKEFFVPYAGTVRLKYQFRSDGQGPQSVNVAVTTAIESSNFACNAGTTSTAFQTKSCDVKVVAGDRVRVSGTGFNSGDPPGQSTVFLRNVRLMFKVVDSAGTGAVLVD
jgi:hypothetical protein